MSVLEDLFLVIFGSKKGVFQCPEAFGEALVGQGRPRSASEPFCTPFGSQFGSILGPFELDFHKKNMSGIDVKKKY